MKKTLLTTMLAALLVLPLGGVAMAQTPEADPTELPAEEVLFVHGDVPAETAAPDSITPAIHGVVLAMLHQGQTEFRVSDSVTGWESLYNMLSLYGEMDDRSDSAEEGLFLPAETVMDFSSALTADLSELGDLPEELSDRMVYDAEADGYILACGNDSLAEVEVASARTEGDCLTLEGSLVYLVDGSDLAQFRAVLAPCDNLFGYAIDSLELA